VINNRQLPVGKQKAKVKKAIDARQAVLDEAKRQEQNRPSYPPNDPDPPYKPRPSENRGGRGRIDLPPLRTRVGAIGRQPRSSSYKPK
jgi:hypothetical protein